MDQIYNNKRILDYLSDLFNEQKLGFQFHKRAEVTVLSRCFGIMSNYLLNNLNHYPLQEICYTIKQCQDPENGLFRDPVYKYSDINGFDEEYLLWQFSYFSIIALDMLEECPRTDLKFIKELKSKSSIREWFDTKNFGDFWRLSNKIMFLLYFLTFQQVRKNMDNSEAIQTIFSILDARQNPNTGFWGESNILEHGMYGAAHIYLYYQYHKQEIKFSEQIIDSVLSMQNEYGLFGSKLGGACEDYNAAAVLLNIAKTTEYRKEDIGSSLCRLYDSLASSQHTDGGFSYNIDNRNKIEKAKALVKFQVPSYKYSGWKLMRAFNFRSDLWSTYFRVLTLASIENMQCPKMSYNFYDLPAWGYF